MVIKLGRMRQVSHVYPIREGNESAQVIMAGKPQDRILLRKPDIFGMTHNSHCSDTDDYRIPVCGAV
jgi:hypothetical protein